MWEFIKKNWKAIGAGIGSIVGFLFLRQYLQGDLKAKLGNQKAQAKDDVLNNEKKHIQEDIKEESKHNQQLRDKLNEPAPESNWKEVEDYYKNKK
jgi:uncharacterized membrane protein YgaE (UPF0421/DUF939 family)